MGEEGEGRGEVLGEEREGGAILGNRFVFFCVPLFCFVLFCFLFCFLFFVFCFLREMCEE